MHRLQGVLREGSALGCTKDRECPVMLMSQAYSWMTSSGECDLPIGVTPRPPPWKGGCGGPYLLPRTPSDMAECTLLPTQLLTDLSHSSPDADLKCTSMSSL